MNVINTSKLSGPSNPDELLARLKTLCENYIESRADFDMHDIICETIGVLDRAKYKLQQALDEDEEE